MRRLAYALAVVVMAGLLTILSAFAHHGWGSYDPDKPMTVEAVIEDVTLANPHGHMMVTTGGKHWEITLAPLSRMQSRGATAAVVIKGKPVKAYGYPKRDGTAEMRAEWIEVDGKRFELR